MTTLPNKYHRDHTGMKYGMMAVLSFDHYNKETRNSFWLCRCDCGTLKVANIHNLKTGQVISCGCATQPKVVDLIGKKYGYYTVLSLSENRNGVLYWNCRCDCGTEKVIYGGNLKNGRTQSCGCKPYKAKHRLSNTRLYGIYTGMIERCHNPKSAAFEDYGGRGIRVCDEWKNERKSFFDWALTNGYSEYLEIDRRNNDGNYAPENCRWVTRKTNSRNRRNTLYLTIGNTKKPVIEWCEDLQISYTHLINNTNNLKINREEAIKRRVTKHLKKRLTQEFKILFFPVAESAKSA